MAFREHCRRSALVPNVSSRRCCMISYLLAKRRFLRSFQAQDGAYLFRRKPTAEAVRVTSEERMQLLRTFRSTYWKSYAILWLSFMALIVGAISISVVADVPEHGAEILGYGIAIIFLVGFFYVDRHVVNAVVGKIEQREAVKPSRSWLQIIDEGVAAAPWWRMLAGAPVFVFLAWMTLPWARSSKWAGVAWLCYFGFLFGFWARNVWRKWQMGRSV